MMTTTEVLIAGAGAAGLIAARELAAHCQVTLVEAAEQAGGRIRTLRSNNGYIVEAGAEFVHGRLPLTQQLAAEAAVDIVSVEGRMYRKGEHGLHEEQQMIAGWDALIDAMGEVRGDTTLQNFLDRHYAGSEQAELRQQAIAYAEGFDVADPARASIRSLYREWSEEEENFRIRQGYGPIIELLQRQCTDKGCKLIVGERVEQVDWKAGEVALLTDKGNRYTAGRALLTLPAGVMRAQSNDIAVSFQPAVDDYQAAYRQLGFGTVIKVVLEFSERFWKPDTGFVFSNEKIPTWWTRHPDAAPLLTGWVGGPAADSLSGLSDEDLLQLALDTVASLFDREVVALRAELRQWFVFNWSRQPNTCGAYSFSTPETPKALALLNTPIENTLFFAGEGLYQEEHPGTVEAAFRSGLDAAAKILAAMDL